MLPDWLPPGLTRLLEPLLSPWVLIGVTAVSVALFASSLVGVSWVVKRIPPDYLLSDAPRPPARGVTLLGRVLRNLMGAALIALGIALLVLPGQGLLTLLVGLMLVDFPGKRRLERRMLAIPSVLGAINHVRRRAGREPLAISEPRRAPSEPRPPRRARE